MKEVIHITCGKIAFYTKNSVTMDDPIRSEDIIKLNGEHPHAYDPIICGSCNQSCGLGDLAFGKIVDDYNVIFTKDPKCPYCMNDLKIITNRRMDEQIELIPICKKCKKAIRDSKYGWKIIE